MVIQREMFHFHDARSLCITSAETTVQRASLDTIVYTTRAHGEADSVPAIPDCPVKQIPRSLAKTRALDGVKVISGEICRSTGGPHIRLVPGPWGWFMDTE